MGRFLRLFIKLTLTTYIMLRLDFKGQFKGLRYWTRFIGIDTMEMIIIHNEAKLRLCKQILANKILNERITLDV